MPASITNCPVSAITAMTNVAIQLPDGNLWKVWLYR
jgi:hypothetical protein